MKSTAVDILNQNKIFAWTGLGTGLVLFVPLLAMQFSDEVTWTPSDFVVMGTLLFGMSSLFILAARKVQGHRLLIALLFFALTIYIWAELAVGFFTSIGN